MAITCPKCGAGFDVTLFAFGHRVRCDCGTEIEYPGANQQSGHVAVCMPVDSARPALNDRDPLLNSAITAATEFVADFERAGRLTNDWADENLSDLLVEEALVRCLRRLTETGCWGEENRLPSGEFWRIAGSLLQPGELQRHARFKPRGYAGDFQMLDWIDTHYCCGHPLGRAFDRYFQRQAAPEAVRHRTRQTAAMLAAHCLEAGDEEFHVVSVGSGAAADIRQALTALPEFRRERTRATLLDLDPDALDFAQRQLAPMLPPGAIRCFRENLSRLPQHRRANELLGSPDFLICSGLFDYLDYDLAAAMLALFWQRLAPGGSLLVWNFAPHNPTRTYMEWIGNWYLTYRTVEELERLAESAEIPRERIDFGSESLGIDLFLHARK